MPRLSNPVAIFLLGICVGWAVNLSYIGAQAYFISQTQPVYGIYVSIASGLAFSTFLRNFRIIGMKFARFSILSVLLYAFLLAVVAIFPQIPALVRAVAWFFLALFAMSHFRWMTTEMAIKYLDPPRAQAFYTYLITADEIGVLLAAASLWLLGTGTSPSQTIYMALMLYGLILLCIGFQFVPNKNFEIKFTSKPHSLSTPPKRFLKMFALAFISLTLCFGAIKTCEEYFLRISLKDGLWSFVEIKRIMSEYTFAASCLSILISYMVGKWNQGSRISPIRLLQLKSFLMLIALCLTWFIPSLSFVILLEITRLVTSNCLYKPAIQTVLGSFISEFRNKFGAQYNLYFFIAASLPFGLLFIYTQRMPFATERIVVLSLLLFFLLLAFPIIYYTKNKLTELHYQFIATGHKTASIISVQTLSFLRPPDYGERMRDLLSLDPKKLLRKNIILGLGFCNDEAATETIIQEFDSDKEMIQLAVLEALRVSRNYKATQFMFNILGIREKPKSLKVRMHAAFLIAGMYGKKAIPILLNELESSEPRIVANILEALSLFRDKDLIPYFKQHLESGNSRIKANALMGLGQIRSTRKLYRETLHRFFEERDPKLVAPLLYVVGKLEDEKAIVYLNSISNSALGNNLRVMPCLAWAWAKLGKRQGFDLFGELFDLPYKKVLGDKVLNLFAQLKKETRFDIIKYLAFKWREQPVYVQNLANNLRHSQFNYYEEIEYLHYIANEVQTFRRRPSPAH